MINYESSLRANFIKFLRDKNPSHAEKVLFVTASLSKGIVGEPVRVGIIKQRWPKTLFAVTYHSKYVQECEDSGWIERPQTGQYALTDEGMAHLNELIYPINTATALPLSNSTELLVFSAKQAHDFDSLIRKALAAATAYVMIADSYVDDTIFDTLLGVIPSLVRIDLMYNNGATATFHARAKRFKVQYPGFNYGHYPKLHDRYIVIDGIGFVVGPSLKDATVNAPAIVVRIDSEQSKRLTTSFTNIYKNVTKNT